MPIPGFPPVNTATTDHAPRHKKWAPRSRSGCFTCRTGRVKCDEAKPVCGRCVRLGKHCSGYGVVMPTRTTSNVLIAPKTVEARPSHPPGICIEAEPPSWDHMQAIRFCTDHVLHFLPAQSAHLPQPSAPRFDTWSHMPVFLICSMVTQQLQWASAARGRVLRPGEDPAFAGTWAKYFGYYRKLLGVTNACIENGGPGKYRALFCIFGLFCMDIKADEPLWQAHLNGAFAYVDKMGGLEALLQFPPSFSGYVLKDLKHVLLQVRGLDFFTDADMMTIIKSGTVIQPPLPVDIFISIARFTQLRIAAVTGSIPETDISDAAQTQLATLNALDPEAWAAEHGLGDYPLVAATGRIFQAATQLYVALTLGRVQGLVHGMLPALQKRLVTLLDAIWNNIRNHGTLLWPLIVAGVAAAGGSEEDRAFVAQCFHTGSRSRNLFVEFSRCGSKLEQIWADQVTDWDDCFKEPFVCMV
ncbi:C6 finger domain [Cordyceps militaris]|uniref:C6 finger domain n=1 Tax=Cordyceps militaris TaxID=73501 RepID=A0A2H4SR13_CORMI|nr:C6 finger domain [Cordyceps militaris]